MTNLPDQESITSSIRRGPWSLGNDILYKMCADNFYHKTDEEIVAKVWLIGRSYAVAIERRKNKGTNDDGDKFYTKTVVKAFQSSKLDQMLEEIRGFPDINAEVLLKTIELHFYVTSLISNITALNKRSFSSKYLHFHLPSLFYIYDSRASTSLRRFKITMPSDLKSLLLNKNLDKEYADFACKCFLLKEYIKDNFSIKLNPRQIDNILLERE